MSTFNGTCGHLGMPGAPIMQFTLHSNGQLILPNSQVTITQAIAPPYGHKQIHVTGGTVQMSVFGAVVTYYITITGIYHAGWLIEPFHATLTLNSRPGTNHLTGTGGWMLSGQNIQNAPAQATIN